MSPKRTCTGGLVVGREAVDNIEPGAVTIFPDEAKLRYESSSHS